ncbi:hypothetical protein HOLleu_39273 [Holothuria leucospilota]|uniref:Uncharacterized protein n=1 Tax=Holothuria leucospilota TaxID=206669 RepID=A0A9Q0YN50_HOLLE|nr:hypothetical protein HOLleu_39273 [Holothuria leucospilota]
MIPYKICLAPYNVKLNPFQALSDKKKLAEKLAFTRLKEMKQFDETDKKAKMTGEEDDVVNYNIDEDADSDIDMESQTAAVTK